MSWTPNGKHLIAGEWVKPLRGHWRSILNDHLLGEVVFGPLVSSCEFVLRMTWSISSRAMLVAEERIDGATELQSRLETFTIVSKSFATILQTTTSERM